MPVNKEHLLKIKAHILEEPKRLRMGDWLIVYKPDELTDLQPKCGTVGCIAGWSHVLRGEKKQSLAVDPDKEQVYLGLQSDDLFYVDQWPVDIHTRYKQAYGDKARAQVTAEAIDRIIAGDGAF